MLANQSTCTEIRRVTVESLSTIQEVFTQEALFRVAVRQERRARNLLKRTAVDASEYRAGVPVRLKGVSVIKTQLNRSAVRNRNGRAR